MRGAFSTDCLTESSFFPLHSTILVFSDIVHIVKTPSNIYYLISTPMNICLMACLHIGVGIPMAFTCKVSWCSFSALVD